MKLHKLFISSILIIIFLILPFKVEANMAAPKEDSVGSSITFEESASLEVLSEVLDIKINKSIALINATYHMKNTSDSNVTTASMFLSPNIAGDTRVIIDSKDVSYKEESYSLSYNYEIGKEDWRYVVLNKDDSEGVESVSTILFDMSFKPKEEKDIAISYSYALGGYPSYDFDVRSGSLKYYLLPAKLWKGFNSLEINLYLDDNLPVLSYSSLEFKHIKDNHYQYRSSSMPDRDLELRLSLTSWQSFILAFNSPYLMMNIMMLLPVILIGLAILIVIIVVVYRVRKKKKLRE